MTYNFDPDGWLNNELAALEFEFKAGRLDESAYERQKDQLMERYAVGFPGMFFMTLLISAILAGKINACPLELPTTSVSINLHVLVVELAATPQSRACGLSNRTALNENHGMLFVYPGSGLRTFWMKDTWIPLSIAFLDDSGKIINIEIMSPDQTEERYHSSMPATYALEVNQGWFRLHGIKAGDRVEMKYRLQDN